MKFNHIYIVKYIKKRAYFISNKIGWFVKIILLNNRYNDFFWFTFLNCTILGGVYRILFHFKRQRESFYNVSSFIFILKVLNVSGNESMDFPPAALM